jgi:hypothetical protein
MNLLQEELNYKMPLIILMLDKIKILKEVFKIN